MDFELSARSEQWRQRLQAFFDSEVLPRHRAWVEHVARSRETAPFMGELQQKARACGGCGISACLNWRPTSPARVCRTLNMRRWPKLWAAILGPLKSSIVRRRRSQHDRAAELRQLRAESALAAATAGSRNPFGLWHDRAGCGVLGRGPTSPRQLSATVTITSSTAANGSSPVRRIRAADSSLYSASPIPVADRTRRHSCVIVPMDAPGVRLVRPLRWMGCEDHVAPIGEINFGSCAHSPGEPARRRGRGFYRCPRSGLTCKNSSLHALDRAV